MRVLPSRRSLTVIAVGVAAAGAGAVRGSLALSRLGRWLAARWLRRTTMAVVHTTAMALRIMAAAIIPVAGARFGPLTVGVASGLADRLRVRLRRVSPNLGWEVRETP